MKQYLLELSRQGYFPIGADLGAANTKVVTADKEFVFPSIVCSGRNRFVDLNGNEGRTIQIEGEDFYITTIPSGSLKPDGVGRLTESSVRPALLNHILEELKDEIGTKKVILVTSVPTSFSKSIDFERVMANEKRGLPDDVVSQYVQTEGTAASRALYASNKISHGSFLVIDVGGSTTDLTATFILDGIPQLDLNHTFSVDLGILSAIQDFKSMLEIEIKKHPSLKEVKLSESHVSKAWKENKLILKGLPLEILDFKKQALNKLLNLLKSRIDLESIDYERLFVTGGGSYELGLEKFFLNAEPVENPLITVARGNFIVAVFRALKLCRN